MHNEVVFGKIYQDFYQNLNVSDAVINASRSLSEFNPFVEVSEKSFLDAGCGGGLFSLSAKELGFKNVCSFDSAPVMVDLCKNLKQQKEHRNWTIKLGCLLNKNFLKTLGQFDYVYCWGVVHHTGKMWEALENISNNVKPGGFLYVGIYNKADSFHIWDDGRIGTSLFWEKIKEFNSKQNSFVQEFILRLFRSIYRLTNLFSGYKFDSCEQRGMSQDVALKDWLFGYPYEYASKEEVLSFMSERGFQIKKVKTNQGLRTNHYLFQRLRDH